jgi:Na+/H+-dicarboxylate symporter
MKAGATLRILAGVIAGLVLGVLAGAQNPFIPAAQLIGGAWLDGLRMTVIPLVFGLIVTGIGSTLRSGGAALTRRALASFVALLALSAGVGLALGELLFAGWALPGPLAAPDQALPALPATADTIRAMIPANPIGAAAQGAIVPVVIFALIFAFALARIEAARAQAIGELLAGVVDAMLVIVGWVLWLAPLGVFALAFAVAAQTGFAVGAALGWYVLVQIIATLALALIIYGLVALSRRVPIGPFVRAAAPAQAVAFTTQSSLASLPAMLAGARALGLARAEADMLLPMAVALFRIAAPASIVIVSLALAHLAGVTLGPLQLAIIAGLAVVNTLTIAGLPNQITFFAAYAPPALAAGVPIELLRLMLAVDAIPDMAYTVSNVTADLGVTALLAPREDSQA